jgi:hypothetical protein
LSRLERREGRALKNIREYRKTHRVQINTFLLVFIVSFMWAVSTTVVINQNVLIDIKLPRLILGAFSIFRASGRFIWLPCMIVMTTALWLVNKLDRHSAAAAVTICVWLNIMDLRNYQSELNKQYNVPNDNYISISREEWDKASEGADEVIFLPLPQDYKTYMSLYFETAALASEDKIKLSSFYLARSDHESIIKYADDQYKMLTSGNGRTDALYVFFNEESVPKKLKNFEMYKVGDYIFGRVKK